MITEVPNNYEVTGYVSRTNYIQKFVLVGRTNICPDTSFVDVSRIKYAQRLVVISRIRYAQRFVVVSRAKEVPSTRVSGYVRMTKYTPRIADVSKKECP